VLGHPHFLFEEAHLEGVLERLPNMVVVEMVAGGDPHRGVETEEDPHVWLSPAAMKTTAVEIAAALAEIDPEHAAEFRQRQSFVVYHAAWGHFAREFGLEQRAIEQEGKEPSPARLVDLIELARQHDVRVIFVQEGFSEQGARVVANEIGAEVRALDPLALDWSENLIRVATALRRALAGC
jgi:zinc transport system substrate-binding protein